VWQIKTETGTNVVDVYINYLRRKLDVGEPLDATTALIETVRGRGYRLGALGRAPAKDFSDPAQPAAANCA